jgi:hypothetical protein
MAKINAEKRITLAEYLYGKSATPSREFAFSV